MDINYKNNSRLVGFDDLKNHFFKLYQQYKIPHAIILNGDKGIGKATFAYHIARFLFANEKFEDRKSVESFDLAKDHYIFEKINMGGMTDLLEIKRELAKSKKKLSNFITIDQIKKIPEFLHKTSSEGGWRVIIIDEIERFNKNSSNALLKILEEPPAKTLFLMICNNSNGVLDTIKSRSRMFKADALSDTDMARALSFLTKGDVEEIRTMIRFSNGSVGKAIDLYENKAVDFYNKAENAMLQFLSGRKSEMISLINSVVKNEVLSVCLNDFIKAVHRDVIMKKSTGNLEELDAGNYRKIIENICNKIDENKALEMIKNLNKFESELKMSSIINIEKTTVYINCLEGIVKCM